MKIAGTMLPCPLVGGDHGYEAGHEPQVTPGEHEHHRKLLWHERRFLAAGSVSAGCKQVSASDTFDCEILEYDRSASYSSNN